MSIKATKNFEPLARLPLTGTALMQEVGQMAARLIRTRTERGVDAKGRAFQPLSRGYGEQKRKALGHSRADLVVSGRMLNDMGVSAVTESSVEIGFRSMGGGSAGGTFIQRSRSLGAADKAFFHNTVGAGKSRVKREFFDLAESDMDQIQAVVDKHLEAVL